MLDELANQIRLYGLALQRAHFNKNPGDHESIFQEAVDALLDELKSVVVEVNGRLPPGSSVTVDQGADEGWQLLFQQAGRSRPIVIAPLNRVNLPRLKVQLFTPAEELKPGPELEYAPVEWGRFEWRLSSTWSGDHRAAAEWVVARVVDAARRWSERAL